MKSVQYYDEVVQTQQLGFDCSRMVVKHLALVTDYKATFYILKLNIGPFMVSDVQKCIQTTTD